jgi:hypothetical protein
VGTKVSALASAPVSVCRDESGPVITGKGWCLYRGQHPFGLLQLRDIAEAVVALAQMSHDVRVALLVESALDIVGDELDQLLAGEHRD